MITRRRTIYLALTALWAAWVWSSRAYAEPAFQRFIPFLIDLEGRQGKKPEGFSMEMTGNNMITATREYQRGAARLHAQVIIGAAAQGALAATQAGMNVETSDGRMSTSTIDGLRVTRTYNTKDKPGAILIALGTTALFSVSFNGRGDEEALLLAKKFDWKAIQGATH